MDATLELKRKKDETGKTISNKANDEDASYTSKRGRKHHGYKIHIVTDVITTTVKVHDSTQFEALTKDEITVNLN